MADIDVLLQEHRRFPPPDEFRRKAHVGSPEIYERAAADPEAFWAGCAEALEWTKPWSRVLEWAPPKEFETFMNKSNEDLGAVMKAVGIAK